MTTVTSQAATVGVNVSGAEYSWMPYVGASDLEYLASEGVTLIRLPISWERMQPTLNGPLDPTYLSGLEKVLTEAAAVGIKVVVDLHNYGGYDANYAAQAAADYGVVTEADKATSAKIGTAAVPISSFASFWQQLATQLSGHAGLAGYDIMNEPNSMPNASVWPQAAQAAVNAIRTVDMNTQIYVEGDDWSSTHNWLQYNANLHITDPANKIIYEAHAYFDNGSGTYTETYAQQGDTPQTGVQDVQPFLNWLQANHYQGFVGEIGAPSNDANWNAVLHNALNAIHAAGVSSAVWNYVYADPTGKNPWWPNQGSMQIDPAMNSGSANAEMIFSYSAPTIIGFSAGSGVVGGTTSANHVTLTGTGAANATVKVFDGSIEIGAVTAAANGTWSFTTGTLTNSAHSFTATDTDAAGTVSELSAALNITVNDVAPAAPTVSSFSPDSNVVGDGITNVNHLTLAGTAVAGSTVEVFSGATEIGTAIANSSGSWSFATGMLADGTHAFTAEDMNAAGTVGAASAALNVTIDTVAPGAPVILSDASASVNSLIVSGTAEPGSTVNLFEGTTLLATGLASASGTWSIHTGSLSAGTHNFTAAATDAAGNVSSISNVLDPVIGQAAVIEAFGSTSLVEVGSNYFLDSISSSTGPELKYAGAAITAGQFAPYTPVGVEQTAGGYEVAFKYASAGLFSIWQTDSNGNFLSYAVYSGTSAVLETLESSFHQDLNGDGVIGIPVTSTVIEALGSTSLVQVGSNYFLDSISSGTGPELKYAGAAITAGQFAPYTPVGVEQLAGGGYEVAFQYAAGNQFSIWQTDSNGNFLSYAVYSGTSTALEFLETTFHQDLNGDGVIGIPAATGTIVEAFGSTSLVEVGSNYFLDSISSGTGPELKYVGAAITAGQFAPYTPVGVEQTAGGYEVAFQYASAGLFSIWQTDSNGNFLSYAVYSGTSTALESAEATFHQDLNGDGVIGIYAAPGATLQLGAGISGPATIGAGATLDLATSDSGSVTFAGATGRLVLDHSSSFTGSLINLTGNGNPASSDQIDLKDIGFGTGTTESYTGNSSGGVLTISDAQHHTAQLSLVGNYTNSTFTLSSDGNGGTIVIDPPEDNFKFASAPAPATGAGLPSVTVGATGSDAFIFHQPVSGNSENQESVPHDGFASEVGNSSVLALANEAQSDHQWMNTELGHPGSMSPMSALFAGVHTSEFLVHN